MRRSFDQLRRQMPRFDTALQAECRRVLDCEGEIRTRLLTLRDRRITTIRTRTHGDMNLRQALFTGKDFVLIDFEGDPYRPLSERRIKRSPLRDATGMLRSFHYASHAVLFGQVSGVVPQQSDAAMLERWADYWYANVAAAFLKGYLATPGIGALLPTSRQDVQFLLDIYQIEQGLQEVDLELAYRPDWLLIPMHGLVELLET